MTQSPNPLALMAWRRTVACAAALLLLAPAVQAEPVYEASMLALPGAAMASRAFGLSGGVVVGQVTGADGLPRAVVWTDAQSPQMLAAGVFESTALAISGNSIVGLRANAGSPSEFDALRWPNGAAAPTALGQAGGGAAARAAAAQYAAGSMDAGAFVYDAFSGTMTLFDAPGAVAHGVNAAGVAVGQDARGLPVAFNGVAAGFIDVLGAAGDASGTAYAVLGDQVVGFFDDPDTFQQMAFLARLGEQGGRSLFAGTAFALNAAGVVVGADFDGGLAMLYSGGVAYDLNQLVTRGLDGYTLTQARAIDDQGRIVAFGVDANGNERAFLLRLAGANPDPQPVPAPATLALAAAALALLRLRRR